MTDQAPTSPPAATDGGFWRLAHDDLAAALARRDLKGESLRVYLALADLTRGYQKGRDVVSLSQIAERAGGLSRPHVSRALGVLSEKGLYGQADAPGQDVVRWVVWPPPPVPATGNTPAPVPDVGNTTVAGTGNRTVPGAVPGTGKHQDTKKRKKEKKGAAAPPQGDPPKLKHLTKGDGACGRLVALWVDSFPQRVGRDFPASGKGRLAGTLKAMLAGTSDADLAAAIERWFAPRRKDYGIALFKGKVEGGDAELTGRNRGGFEEDPIALYNGRKLAAEMAEDSA